MPIAQLGQINLSALSVPQALIQIVPPQYLFNGVPTNVGGVVGSAAWGPVNLAQPFGNYAQFASIFGPTVNRKYDMGGHIILAAAQGAGYFSGVRVTDGTDLAASATVQGTGLTVSGRYTGSLGNKISLTTSPGSRAGSYKAVVSAPGLGFEIFDNLMQGVASVTTVAGTTYTAVPTATVDLPPAGGTQAIIQPTLTTYGSPVVVGGGTGHVTGDLLSFANGLVLNVTATAGVVTSATVVTPGKLLVGPIPANPLPQVSSTGAGIGLTATVTWCLGAPVIKNPGFGYVSAPNIALAGGGTGSGGSYTAIVSYWANIAYAINNGSSSIRPASAIAVAAAGTLTALPLSQTVTLSGGTDGANSLTTSMLLGADTSPRTGMYALRNQGVAQLDICDLDDVTSFLTQVAYGTDIGAYMIGVTPASDTLTNAQTELSANGVDSFVMKCIFGDWIIWNDTINQVPLRITSPQAIALGLLGNLSPQNNLLNKPIQGIIGTQSSLLGKTYSYSDYQVLSGARMDVVALDKTLTNNFIFRLGLNTSSNPVIFGDEYTRVIFFFAKSFQIIAAQYVGQTQTPDERRRAKISLQEFCALQQFNGIIGTADGSQCYQVILDTSNNTQTTVALGYQFAYVKIIIFGIVRYFIVSLEGGASVTISATPSQPFLK